MNKDPNAYSAAGEVGSVLESRSTFTKLKIELNKATMDKIRTPHEQLDFVEVRKREFENKE